MGVNRWENFAEICQIMDSLYYEDIAPVNDRIKVYLEVFVRLNVATVLSLEKIQNIFWRATNNACWPDIKTGRWRTLIIFRISIICVLSDKSVPSAVDRSLMRITSSSRDNCKSSVCIPLSRYLYSSNSTPLSSSTSMLSRFRASRIMV